MNTSSLPADTPLDSAITSPASVWEQIRPQLERSCYPFPLKAIEAAREARAEITPHLLALLDALATDPEPATNGNYVLHIHAIHLLAEWRETRAYHPLIRLVTQPADISEAMFDISAGEYINRALGSVCDGDLSPLITLIQNPAVDPWLRATAADAMAIRALEGDADVNEVRTQLMALIEAEIGRQTQDVESVSWLVPTFLLSAMCDVGVDTYWPRIKLHFEAGVFDETYIDRPYIEADLAESFEQRQATLRRHDKGYINDIASTFGKWYCFSKSFHKQPHPKAASSPPANSVDRVWHTPPIETYIREQPKTGRNDPCHCGSGLKYKKCHGI